MPKVEAACKGVRLDPPDFGRTHSQVVPVSNKATEVSVSTDENSSVTVICPFLDESKRKKPFSRMCPRCTIPGLETTCVVLANGGDFRKMDPSIIKPRS